MARKKKVLEAVTVTDFAAEGKCFVKHDGQIVFLNTPNIAPGDVVDVLIKRKKSNHSEGIVLRTISLSPLRREPICSHFGTCGGCKWQHIPYEMQLEQKQKQVYDHLERIGKIDIAEKLPILPTENEYFYRNKLEFTFSNSRWLTKAEVETGDEFDRNSLGFHVPKRFDKVIPIEKCYLQPDPSNQIRNYLDEIVKEQGYTYYDHVKHEGFMRNMMVRTSTLNQVLILIQFGHEVEEDIEFVMNAMGSKFPEITSLNYVVNTKGNDTIYDLEINNYSGQTYIEEQIEELRFKITPKSFYQTNPKQAINLYNIAKDFADLKESDVLYDLYTGTGTIALFLAKYVSKVIGVESVKEAIEDAKINAVTNGIENSQFFAGDMKKVLNAEFVNKHGQPDVIVLDPPRAGLDKEVVETLLTILPERIIYVSCNTATQSRDLALLNHAYETVKVQPVDMFPQTHHVENVAKLVLRK
ncbi:MAG: 23S rRNA (uracil1939-C5)-methyltransferase [Spirosomataceae bacterium]|jgi:23S rRNA (uracil1939-C5)-methyltransferase